MKYLTFFKIKIEVGSTLFTVTIVINDIKSIFQKIKNNNKLLLLFQFFACSLGFQN